jgi:hypothetical protein
MGRGGPRGRHSSDGEEFSRQAYLSPQDRETFSPIMSEIQGSLKARLYDANMQIVKETGVRDLVKEISENPGVKTVVFDGVITSRLVEAAEIAGVEKIVGQRTGKIEGRHSVRTIALSQ